MNMKLQQMKTGTFFITLPSPILRAKGWVKGDYIVAEINKEGNIVLKKRE